MHALVDVAEPLMTRFQVATHAHRNHDIGDMTRLANWGKSFWLDGNVVLAVSPYNPYRRARMIEKHWDKAQPNIALWEKQGAEQPTLLLALGRRYLSSRQLDDAQRCLARAVELDPSLEPRKAFAELQKQRGDVRAWIVALHELAKDPQSDFDVEAIPMLVANYYIGQRMWDAARPYADGAARTGGARALLTAGLVYEGLQEFDRAAELIRKSSVSDEELAPQWYFLCKRTGLPSADAAYPAAEAYVDQRSTLRQNSHSVELYDQMVPGTIFLLANKPGAARRYLEEDYMRSRTPRAGLFVVTVASKQVDQARHAAMLEEITKKTSKKNQAAQPLAFRLAQLMADDLSTGGKAEFNHQDVDKLIASGSVVEQIELNYFLAEYLRSHSKTDEAIEYWKRCMAGVPLNAHCRTLAGAELAQRGVGPASYKAALQTPLPPDGR